jgi:predicted ATPase
MLTRLKVSGFKNLANVDVRFGAFTCIAGANGVGKSNLFDAIRFLSDLADHSLLDAATSVRDEDSRANEIRRNVGATDITSLFRKYKDESSGEIKRSEEMYFEAEMVIPKTGDDDYGQQATASATFLRYTLKLAYRNDENFSSLGGLEIIYEDLIRVQGSTPKSELISATSKTWYKSIVYGNKTIPLISTVTEPDKRVIKLHQDGKQGGSPVPRNAKTLPRTVLSSTNAAENQTALLARNEMRSWRLLQLEPTSLRRPDSFTSPTEIGEDGSHLAATLYYLAQTEKFKNATNLENKQKSFRIYGQIATKLSELIDDVYSVKVDRDEQRQTLTLQVTDKNKTSYPARALSDGTLRFLALAVIELDPTAQGVICLEEPENGIHPARIAAILKLLEAIAADTTMEVGLDNPLRQVIINTHSPAVVGQVKDDDLLVAETKSGGVYFSCLPDTWRDKKCETPTLSRGTLAAYLNPVGGNPQTPVVSNGSERPRRRVIDRDDLQLLLPFPLA